MTHTLLDSRCGASAKTFGFARLVGAKSAANWAMLATGVGGFGYLHDVARTGASIRSEDF